MGGRVTRVLSGGRGGRVRGAGGGLLLLMMAGANRAMGGSFPGLICA